jgi:hypothetical protein
MCLPIPQTNITTHEFAFFNSSLQFHIYFALMRQSMGSNEIINWFGWNGMVLSLVLERDDPILCLVEEGLD